jgi:hypothetical protein
VRRVTYIAAGSPRSRRTSGLVKIGQSTNPQRRARGLSTHLLGTTSIGEGTLREMLRPYLAPFEETSARRLDDRLIAGRSGEWYIDCPAVRMLAAWACEFRPAEEEA